MAEEWDPVPLFSATTTSSGSAAGFVRASEAWCSGVPPGSAVAVPLHVLHFREKELLPRVRIKDRNVTVIPKMWLVSANNK